MNKPVPVSGRKLLKEIHISELQVVCFVSLVTESKKKPVLIEIVVDYFFSKIHMHFVVKNKCQ
jgi:hypothetical protein